MNWHALQALIPSRMLSGDLYGVPNVGALNRSAHYWLGKKGKAQSRCTARYGMV